MSHPNFYNNFTTFQNNVRHPPQFNVPPPPPPPFFQPFPPQSPDQNIVQIFEAKINAFNNPKKRQKTTTITAVRQQLRNMVTQLNQLKEKEKCLQDKVETLSDTEWNESMKSLMTEKLLIENTMSQINDTYLDATKNALAKRSAKRLRLKRVNLERKREKEDRQKQWEEKGRKIDENLQKIKDEITKVNQEKESKEQADVILREVFRKKQDAKRCIAKLEGMAKLRKARENTAKGRGVYVSETDAAAFDSNIEKIKSLWHQKLTLYEKEESDLRAKLSSDAQRHTLADTDQRVVENLARWTEFLFGASLRPQVDFRGDAARFIAVRCTWDTYISDEGSPIPVGWAVPS